MKVRISCVDKYEAQKLASLIYIRDSMETNLVSILNTIEDELVISLKDKSAHSILMEDKSHADAFADFVQSVVDGEHKIIRTTTLGRDVEIEKV